MDPRLQLVVAMLLLMGYDLTEDSRFLRAARAAAARYLLHGGETPSSEVVHNVGQIDPELGGWLQEMEAVSTEPFTITSEVPTPDPANFT